MGEFDMEKARVILVYVAAFNRAGAYNKIDSVHICSAREYDATLKAIDSANSSNSGYIGTETLSWYEFYCQYPERAEAMLEWLQDGQGVVVVNY